MKIKSTLPYPVEVPNLGIAAEPGEAVDVPDADSEALIESGAWVAAPARRVRPARVITEKSRTTAAKEK